MLYYHRMELSQKLMLLKVIKVKMFMICHYWLFNHELKFQDSVCNDCYDLTILYLNISHVPIVTVKAVGYRCIFMKRFIY